MKKYELQSIYGKNKGGYYHKAVVIEDENGDKFLQSYSTIVCGIVNGVFQKYWNDYSATTMQHINDFRMQNDLDGMSKKEWESLQTSIRLRAIFLEKNNYKIQYYN